MAVLRYVAERAGGLVVVATLASEEAVSLWQEYRAVFRKLGVPVEHLDIERRDRAYERRTVELLSGARCVFFTGGDQLRITSKLGGSAGCDALRAMHARGGVVAGTSAGASVMADTMLVSGTGGATPSAVEGIAMAPGLGLLRDVVIDQHFAQRGRIGRLLRAVASNPRILGVGLDEDTGLVIEADGQCSVIGSGAVYVVDGRFVSQSNVSEGFDVPLSLFGARLDVLNGFDKYDLKRRVAAHEAPAG
jgi:cyanophycinase